MNITRTTNEGNREYQLLDQNKVNQEKDIGVTIKDSLLSFELQLQLQLQSGYLVISASRHLTKDYIYTRAQHM